MSINTPKFYTINLNNLIQYPNIPFPYEIRYNTKNIFNYKSDYKKRFDNDKKCNKYTENKNKIVIDSDSDSDSDNESESEISENESKNNNINHVDDYKESVKKQYNKKQLISHYDVFIIIFLIVMLYEWFRTKRNVKMY